MEGQCPGRGEEKNGERGKEGREEEKSRMREGSE